MFTPAWKYLPHGSDTFILAAGETNIIVIYNETIRLSVFVSSLGEEAGTDFRRILCF